MIKILLLSTMLMINPVDSKVETIINQGHNGFTFSTHPPIYVDETYFKPSDNLIDTFTFENQNRVSCVEFDEDTKEYFIMDIQEIDLTKEMLDQIDTLKGK